MPRQGYKFFYFPQDLPLFKEGVSRPSNPVIIGHHGRAQLSRRWLEKKEKDELSSHGRGEDLVSISKIESSRGLRAVFASKPS